MRIQLTHLPQSYKSGSGRAVAQPGSASVWGTEGRGFESRLPDQKTPNELMFWRLACEPLAEAEYKVGHIHGRYGFGMPRWARIADRDLLV